MEASAAGVNGPHVNDPDPDDFFADDDAPEMDETAQAEEAAAIAKQAAEASEAEAERLAAAGAPTEAPTDVPTDAPTSAGPSAEVTGDGSGETLPPVEQPGIPDTATAAGRAAAAAAAPPVEQPPTPPVEDAVPPPDPEPEPTKASKDRPYVVLRELALTEETLTKLLEHVRSGADPIDVYLHVETVEARNDQHALKQVYAAHRERIGDRPRLVPVSKRAWRVRQVQPRQRVEEALEIV
jgi:hypothetical protein